MSLVLMMWQSAFAPYAWKQSTSLPMQADWHADD
jgi:hypothetical protein